MLSVSCLALGRSPHHGGDVVNDLPGVAVDLFDAELAALDLGHIEDVVEQPEQVFAVVEDGVDEFARAFCLVDFLAQEFGIADDGGHGGADFVAHVGEELGFGPVGHLSGESGRGKLLVHRLQFLAGLFEGLAASHDFLRPLGDLLLQRVANHFGLASQAPSLRERQHKLSDFDVVERLLQNEEMIGPSEAGDNVLPGVVGVRRTEHDQDFWIGLPDALDRFHAVPARRHANIDERQGIRAVVAQRLLDHRQPFLALVGRVDLKRFGGLAARGRVAEQRRGFLVDGLVVVVLRPNDLAKILVNGFLVVDHQDSDRFRMGHVNTSIGLNGKFTGEQRPHPGPSLCAVSVPPSSLAVFAELCRPNPWPCFFVVNP